MQIQIFPYIDWLLTLRYISLQISSWAYCQTAPARFTLLQSVPYNMSSALTTLSKPFLLCSKMKSSFPLEIETGLENISWFGKWSRASPSLASSYGQNWNSVWFVKCAAPEPQMSFPVLDSVIFMSATPYRCRSTDHYLIIVAFSEQLQHIR